MYPGTQAELRGDKVAVMVHPTGASTYRQLDERSTRLANLLQSRGLGDGDTVALLLENRLEGTEAVWGPLRSGMWVAPLNWHLKRQEVAALLDDSRARALITSRRLHDELSDVLEAAALDVVLVMDADDDTSYEAALASASPQRPEDERLGARLLYSGGSTGRPKGIRQPLPGVHPRDTPQRLGGLVERLGIDTDTVFLNAAPTYHAAPFQFALITSSIGATCVHLERFDAEQYLAAIEQHRVTHAQVVPTMIVRLLRLPDEVRGRYDLSSLRVLVTSGAPCSPALKSAVSAWLGPLVHEYYGASEGYGSTHVSPQEATERPGTVGRAMAGTLHIADPEGVELRPREVGQVWFEGTAAFAYDGDEAKSRQARNDRGWTTVGDLGYLDEDGFLYLTGRLGHTIVSGGVNIYPQEIEDVLLTHPSVLDVAVIGVPDEEFGESVKALVQLSEAGSGTPELAAELVQLVRDQVATYKAPRSIDFVDALPRLPSGKLDKGALTRSYSPAPAITGGTR